MFKTAQNKSSLGKGFTLIELLVVIGILSVLAVAALVTINPAEAQRKARDTQRLQDLGKIQSIVEQYLNDNAGTITVANSSSVGVVNTVKNCATGWLSNAFSNPVANLCTYANVVPVDPSNRTTDVAVTATTTESLPAIYYITWLGSSYKICAHMESKSNYAKVTGDGEGATNTNASKVISVFSTDIQCGP